MLIMISSWTNIQYSNNLDWRHVKLVFDKEARESFELYISLDDAQTQRAIFKFNCQKKKKN